MQTSWVQEVFSCVRPVIGVIHLQPLPGAPRYGGDLPAVIQAACAEARELAGAGVHGLIVENFGDTPFHKTVPACTLAAMTAAACAVRAAVSLPLGLNVLRNDAEAALAIAVASGARFIRVNILSGARLTDQGLIEGQAAALLREKSRLQAGHIRILADVDVKHSAPLAPRPLREEAAELCDRAGADALILTGSGTGQKTSVKDLETVRGLAVPVFIGSGLTAENLADYSAADGFIVGSSLKQEGRAVCAVDRQRAQGFMRRWRELFA